MSWVKKGMNHLVSLAIGLIWVYPLLWMISASFKDQNEFFNNRLGLVLQAPTLDSIRCIWVKANFGSYFLNTVVVTCFAVVLVLIITMFAGYVMGRYKPVGRNLMMGIFVGSIAIPLVSTIIPTHEVVKGMHLTGTKIGLVLAQAGRAHVTFLMLFTGFFASTPIELEGAAKIGGRSFFRIFFNIMMPLYRPIVTTVVIMETIWTWNAFMPPLVLTLDNPVSRTLAAGLYAFKGENTVNWTGIAAGDTITVIPVIILFIILQCHFVEGIADAVKSRQKKNSRYLGRKQQ